MAEPMTPTDVAMTPASSSASRRPLLRRRHIRWLAVAMVAALAPFAWSYATALTAPGTDGWEIRSVEWLRGHWGKGMVDAVERLWYSHHQAPKGGPPPAALVHGPADTSGSTLGAVPGTPATAGIGASGVAHLPAPSRLASLAGPLLPNEGVWQPAGRLVDGVPAVYTTEVRPDRVHSGLATGVAWIDPLLTRAALFAGVQVPGGSWANQAPISMAQRSSLVAAFNSGFRLGESRGGYFADGRTARLLVAGAASLVIDNQGRATVGQWGRDVQMSGAVVAVRQNLSLIVDHGAPVPGLDNNVHGLWGATLGNRLFVWRSGVGVRADGSLVYAAGNGLSVATLAGVLADAGSVRAMELDINSEWTRFFSYNLDGHAPPSSTSAVKLTSDMRSSPGVYLQAESRDFIAVMAR